MKNSFKKITALLTATALVGSFGIVGANAATAEEAEAAAAATQETVAAAEADTVAAQADETVAAQAVATVAAQADETVGALATPQINETWCVNDGVEISWDAVPGAYGYRVFYLGKSGNWRGMGNTKETHFLDDEVSSGSTYTYTVRCIDEDENFVSDYDHTGFQGTYIAPPVLTETESVNEGVKISWDAPNGGSKYRVFYKGASGQWRSMGDTTETSFIDDDVNSGNTYTYTVRCVNEEGTRFVSGYDKQGIKGTYVASPKITATESTSEGVKLTWDACKGAYAYRVYYLGRSGWVRFATTRTTSAIDDVVNSGSTYTYTVRCVDEDGDFVSGYYNDGWKATYIGTPVITKGENTYDGVQLTWEPVKGAERYAVFYKGATAWKSMGTTKDTSFVDDDVNSGSTYTYTVRVVDETGKFISDYERGGFKYTFVATPLVNKYKTDASYNVTLMWNAVKGAAKYRVFLHTANGWVGLGNTDTNSYTTKQATASAVYTVRCLDKDENFISSYDKTGVVVRRTNAAKEVDVTIPNIISHKVSEDQSVSVNWDPIPGCFNYYLYLQTPDGGLKKIGETAEHSFSVSSSFFGEDAAGKTFVFRIRGLNKKGEFVTDYNRNGYNFVYPPELNLKGKFTSTKKDTVEVSWDPVEKVDKYKLIVFHGEDSTQIELTTNTYTYKLPVKSDFYLFMVQAYDSNGSLIAIPGEYFEVNPEKAPY